MLELLAAVPRIFVENPLFVVEALLTLAVVAVIFDASRRGAGRVPQAHWLRRLARRPRLAVASVGLAALGGRLLLMPVLPIPTPQTHDEYSYLLAADTFASGRLTNPAHPMWMHLETLHVNQKPTYMSMYPPAQGMVLAAGKVLFGDPWWGVWLSTGLMCAAICWMLQGWLPPVWALTGGMLAVVRLGWFSYWMNSYWGGAVAAAGGALVLGAAARIFRKPRAADGALLGLGAAILAFSRPYEGLVLGLPVAAALLIHWKGWRATAPAACVLAVAAGAWLTYNARVTGNPLRMPYDVNRQTYVQARYFVWESLNPKPVYNHESLRGFYVDYQRRQSEWALTPMGFVQNSVERLVYFWSFYLGPVLLVPLAMAHRVVRDRRVRLLLVTAAVMLAGLGANLFFVQHYAAPATAVLYALLMQGLRHLRFARWRGRPVGARLAAAVPLVCLCMAGVRLAAGPLKDKLLPSELPTWFYSPSRNTERASMERALESLPGKHLVVVRYTAGHDPEREWIYNGASIDGAKVVWAREMDAVRARSLVAYFRDRRVWLLEADREPLKLREYPEPGGPQGR